MPNLSVVRVRDAKPREKPYKLFDERGLYLLVMPSADQHRRRLWRFRYRHNGTEKLLALGTYPDVSLKRAREKRDEARRLLADGVDPNVQRKTERAAQTETFEAIGREWLAHRAKTTAAITQQKATWLLEQIFAEIGGRPIREVAAPELLWRHCGRSKPVDFTRAPTVPSRSADRFSGTPSPRAVIQRVDPEFLEADGPCPRLSNSWVTPAVLRKLRSRESAGRCSHMAIC